MGKKILTILDSIFLFILSYDTWASPQKNLYSGFPKKWDSNQASLLSYRDYLESWNFACSKLGYDTFQKAKNKGADQTARMRRLVCALVVRNTPTGFLTSRPT